jgi:hypothetical protein
MRIVKKKSQPQLSAMADNFGYRLLCCYFLSLLFIFKNSEKAVLLSSWYVYFCDFKYSIGVGIYNILTKKKVGPAQPQLSMADNYQRIGA